MLARLILVRRTKHAHVASRVESQGEKLYTGWGKKVRLFELLKNQN
jgi:hypothetical protein